MKPLSAISDRDFFFWGVKTLEENKNSFGSKEEEEGKQSEEAQEAPQQALSRHGGAALKTGLKTGLKIARKLAIKAALAVMGAVGPYVVAAVVLFLVAVVAVSAVYGGIAMPVQTKLHPDDSIFFPDLEGWTEEDERALIEKYREVDDAYIDSLPDPDCLFQQAQARPYRLPYAVVMAAERMEMTLSPPDWKPRPIEMYKHLETVYKWMDSIIEFGGTVEYTYTYRYKIKGPENEVIIVTGDGDGTFPIGQTFEVKLLTEADAYDYHYFFHYGDYEKEYGVHESSGYAPIPGYGYGYVSGGMSGGGNYIPPPPGGGEPMRMEITGYAPFDPKAQPGMCFSAKYGRDATASGVKAYVGSGTLENPYVVAVDPRVIPLGSLVYFTIDKESAIGGYGIALDTGGMIKGNKLDVLVESLHIARTEIGRTPGYLTIVDGDYAENANWEFSNFGSVPVQRPNVDNHAALLGYCFQTDAANGAAARKEEIKNSFPAGAYDIRVNLDHKIASSYKKYRPLQSVSTEGEEFEKLLEMMGILDLGYTDLDLDLILHVAADYDPEFAYNLSASYAHIKKMHADRFDMGAFGFYGGGELVHWNEVRGMVPRGGTFRIYDVDTGLSFTVKRYGGNRHFDVEPLTAADTATMRQAYGGSWSWSRRAIIVDINGRHIAASMNGMPHGGGNIRNNQFNGHFCVHFLGSSTHKGQRVCPQHQAMVKKAAGASGVGGGSMVWPVPRSGTYITSGFGPRGAVTSGGQTISGAGFHYGVDIASGGRHVPVYAASGGVVTFSGVSGSLSSGYGRMVKINHGTNAQGQKIETAYAHLHRNDVRVGDRVRQGQAIGVMGTTGSSSGIHLHFEVIINGDRVDPMRYYPNL